MVLDSAFHHRPWEESHCVKHKLAQNVPFFATERSEKLASFCTKSLIKKTKLSCLVAQPLRLSSLTSSLLLLMVQVSDWSDSCCRQQEVGLNWIEKIATRKSLNITGVF